MRNRLVYSFTIALHHVEVIIRSRLAANEFGEKFQPLDLCDRIMEAADAPSEVEHDDKFRVDLIWDLGAQTHTFGIESSPQVLKLRRQALSLPLRTRRRRARQAERALGWPRHDFRRSKR